MNERITIAHLLKAKQQRRAIVAVSCYDYTTARLVAQAPVEMILVGDSAAQLMLGFDTTLPATMDFMVTITAAVRRGAPNVYLVADMPFLSYHTSIPEAIRNAGRFLTEASAQMVKIEATEAYLDTIRAVTDAGIPPLTEEELSRIHAYFEGIQQIERQLEQVLSDAGLKRVETIGQPFDHNTMEAISYEPHPELAEGTVIDELEGGYRLGDKIIRPAKVRVSKGQ